MLLVVHWFARRLSLHEVLAEAAEERTLPTLAHTRDNGREAGFALIFICCLHVIALLTARL